MPPRARLLQRDQRVCNHLPHEPSLVFIVQPAYSPHNGHVRLS
jgi:hypothetical protein